MQSIKKITLVAIFSFFLLFLLEANVFALNPLVALDPGHGGKDDGATSPNGYKEKDANLDIASRVNNLLNSVGIRVLMTRADDTYISLEDRSKLANQAGADIFVSIHNNYSMLADGSTNQSASGTETYYFGGSTRGYLLSSLIQEEVTKRLGLPDRGVKTAGFVVLSHTKMPATLVESAFLSNYQDEQYIRDPAFRQTIAEGIFSGIVKYFEKTSEFKVFYTLPQYFRVHVPTITPNTRIQVSTYFTSTKWVSQPILAPGDYLIRIDPDGFVRSIDNKLAFTKSADGTNASMTIYILGPTNENGADFASYTWTTIDYPSGAVMKTSSGFLNLNTGGVSTSSTENSLGITAARETIYSERLMLRVHLESVTSHTDLRLPFYWKNALFMSQRPLPAGDYWIMVEPDLAPANEGSSPYLLSLDGKIVFRKLKVAGNPDPVFAVYIAAPNRPEVGLDVVGFVHNFRRPSTYQPILGAKPTGPDVGLGFVLNTGVADPARASIRYPTIPTQTLTDGNYIIITDAGLIRGRVMNGSVAKPLSGAKVTINGVSMFTDKNGEFYFTLMTPGTYTLEYSASGFTTQTQVINVTSGRPTYTPWAIMSP